MMKKVFLVLGAAFTLLPVQAYAGETVKVHVNGLVCDFCARAIEKVFKKQESVESINVNLSDKLITLGLKDGQALEDDVITKLVNDSGYALVSIERAEQGQDGTSH